MKSLIILNVAFTIVGANFSVGGTIDTAFQYGCRAAFFDIPKSEALTFLANGKRATPKACCEEDACEEYGDQCKTEQFRSLILDHFKYTCPAGQSVGITSWCAGHIGKTCTDPCSVLGIDQCEHGGTCVPQGSSWICHCQPGYDGTICHKDIDECKTNNPCDPNNSVNCTNTDGSYTCYCKPGFTGKNCQIDIDECVSSPCQNSGSCIDHVSRFECVCRPGYTGHTCGFDIDECKTNSPCDVINSVNCANADGSYTCYCKPGFTGKNCQIDIDECASNPCQNSGSCIDHVSRFECVCRPGYTGHTCGIDIDECASSPCQNGATCSDFINLFRCACAPGFYGTLCNTDIDECASIPCQNSGRCIDHVNRFGCVCRPGYTGPTCGIDIDECASSPCQNGATCSDFINLFRCACAPGFYGTLCETKIDVCASSPCQNSGTCIDHLNLFRCVCAPGFTGTFCERAGCPLVKLNGNGNNMTFQFTYAGRTGYTRERCLSGSGAYASRQCMFANEGGGIWGPITYTTGCQDLPEPRRSESTHRLENLTEINLSETDITTVFSELALLTNSTVNLTETDIMLTAEVLFNSLYIEEIHPQVLNSVYDVANNILARDADTIQAAQTMNTAANRILESVEEIVSNVNLMGNTTLRIVKEFLAAEIWDQLGHGNDTIGLQLYTSTFNDDDDVDGDDSENLFENHLENIKQSNDSNSSIIDVAIYLDEELIKDRKTRTVYQIYSKTSLFTESQPSRFKLISKVVAAQLKVEDMLITDLGNNTVTAIFKPQKVDTRTVCAFWNYTANEASGGWDTTGCRKAVLSDNHIECRCNHLTNFAILIDLEADTISDTDKRVLDVITKLGLIASIIGLGLTILTFLTFKHLRSGRGRQVLINLSVAMLCSSLIFLVGIDHPENRAGCMVAAALLHYFILASFMWMLVEGVLQYLRFVKVLGTYIPRFMAKAMIVAWGSPIIPVCAVAVFDYELFIGGKGYCWLAHDAMLYAFIIPIAAILFINIILFSLVIGNLVRRRSHGMKSNQSERKRSLLHLKAALSIFVLLGLTWTFGLLAIYNARVVFHYVFAFLNTFQGFFIFILFTAREKEICKSWKKLFGMASSGIITSSSAGGGAGRNKLSVDTISSEVRSSSDYYDKSGLSRRDSSDQVVLKNIVYQSRL